MTMSEGPKTFLAGAAIAAHARVKPTAATATDPMEVEEAGLGATDPTIGVALYAAAAGEAVAVELWTSGATKECIAAEAFARGDAVYGAADGKVADTVSGSIIGYAAEAAAADGDIVEVVPV